jgi:hypothetical protein
VGTTHPLCCVLAGNACEGLRQPRHHHIRGCTSAPWGPAVHAAIEATRPPWRDSRAETHAACCCWCRLAVGPARGPCCRAAAYLAAALQGLDVEVDVGEDDGLAVCC